jgi:ribosomal protein S18 acetylase RimI-like enzyme
MSVDNLQRTIRPYQETDEAEVAGVWHRSGLAAYTYLPTWQAMTIETAQWVFTNVIKPNNSIWVGTLNDRVMAYLAMNDVWIDRLYVDPIDWRQGWGNRFVTFAKQQSPHELKLFTHQENYSARALYERHGFVAVKFGVSPPPESAPDVEYHWKPSKI